MRIIMLSKIITKTNTSVVQKIHFKSIHFNLVKNIFLKVLHMYNVYIFIHSYLIHTLQFGFVFIELIVFTADVEITLMYKNKNCTIENIYINYRTQ